MKEPKILENAILAIKSRPRVFLRKLSLRDLDVFMTGFCYGLDAGRPPEEFPHCNEFREFSDWLGSKFPREKWQSWLELILEAEGMDDEAAFHRFFVLWDEFLQTRSS
jgi:hypothetical protein